jgi:hypothetical protein
MFFYPWYPTMMLALEARNVIDLRLWKIASGGKDGAAESQLMVKEKVDAFFEASALLLCGGTSATVVDMYRQHVASNAERLS